jgi:hypothetical protein
MTATKSKAAFVRSLPRTMSAKEVIAKAKAAGLKLSPAYIYVIRSKSTGPSSKAPKTGGGKPGPKPKNGRGLENQFIGLALDIGFGRAQELLNSTKAAVQRTIG